MKVIASMAEFLNMGIPDIWGQIILCCADLSCALYNV